MTMHKPIRRHLPYFFTTGIGFVIALGVGLFGVNGAALASSDLQLTLAPKKPSLTAGSTVAFSVHAKSAENGSFDVSAYATFSTDDPTGTIATGVYHAGTTGQWQIRATYAGTNVHTTVTVTPGIIDHIVVNPNSLPEVVPIGATRQFTAAAFDAQNNPIPNPAITWNLSGNVGSINAAGLFTANKDGQGTISATNGSVFSSVDIIVREAAKPDITEQRPQPVNTSAEPANTNQDQNGSVLGANTKTNEPESNAAICWDVRWWGWLIIMLGFLIVLYAYYWLIQANRNRWWWILPILLTAGALAVFFTQRCGPVAGWFPWVTVILGLLITLFRPLRFVPRDGEPL